METESKPEDELALRRAMRELDEELSAEMDYQSGKTDESSLPTGEEPET